MNVLAIRPESSILKPVILFGLKVRYVTSLKDIPTSEIKKCLQTHEAAYEIARNIVNWDTCIKLKSSK